MTAAACLVPYRAADRLPLRSVWEHWAHPGPVGHRPGPSGATCLPSGWSLGLQRGGRWLSRVEAACSPSPAPASAGPAACIRADPVPCPDPWHSCLRSFSSPPSPRAVLTAALGTPVISAATLCHVVLPAGVVGVMASHGEGVQREPHLGLSAGKPPGQPASNPRSGVCVHLAHLAPALCFLVMNSCRGRSSQEPTGLELQPSGRFRAFKAPGNSDLLPTL